MRVIDASKVALPLVVELTHLDVHYLLDAFDAFDAFDAKTKTVLCYPTAYSFLKILRQYLNVETESTGMKQTCNWSN